MIHGPVVSPCALPAKAGGAAGPPALTKLNDEAFVSTGVASFARNHTIAPGSSNYLLLLRLVLTDSAAEVFIDGAPEYDGIPMTEVPGSAGVAGAMTYAWYYLVDPPTGTKQVNVVLSDVANVAYGLTSFSGANPVLGTAVVATGTGTTASVTIPSASAANYQVDMLGIYATNSTSNGTPASRTSSFDQIAGASPDRCRADASWSRVTGSALMDWTLSISKTWRLVALEVKQAV